MTARLITPTYTFTPGSNQIDLSGISGFSLQSLTGIVNLKTGGVVYARGLPGYGASAVAGTLLTLQASMVGMSGSDTLAIQYQDVGQSPTGTVTQTIVTGTSGTLIAANSARKSLRWMVTGASDITVVPGTTPPTVGQGMIYQSSGTVGKQGASEAFLEGAMATNAFAYAASASTSIVVWECQ